MKYALSPRILNNLKQMGENIRLARLRRNLPMALVCERAGITRPTLIEIEKGSPSVSMGAYTAVIHAINGNTSQLADIMREDEMGRTIQDLNLKTPRRGGR